MRVGILGSGLMGGKLGTLFARAGHEVVFSYARHEQKLKRLAREAPANARAGTPAEAAREADALLLAVHWSRVDDVLQRAGDLSGKVIICCSLPMNADNTGLVVAHTSSGAEALAKMAPRARVVSAFHTVPSEVLVGVFERRRKGTRPSLVYHGDDRSGKKVAAELIRDVGFDPVDAGPLRMARYSEPLALLVAHLAYEGKRGPELAYRFEWLGRRLAGTRGREMTLLAATVVSVVVLTPRGLQALEAGARPGPQAAAATALGPQTIRIARTGSQPSRSGPAETFQVIRPGDVVRIPPGQKHWHGATATTGMAHIAIQEQRDGKTVDWMEKVSDEQYLAGSSAE